MNGRVIPFSRPAPPPGPQPAPRRSCPTDPYVMTAQVDGVLFVVPSVVSLLSPDDALEMARDLMRLAAESKRLARGAR